jgi:hypothetical protein
MIVTGYFPLQTPHFNSINVARMERLKDGKKHEKINTAGKHILLLLAGALAGYSVAGEQNGTMHRTQFTIERTMSKQQSYERADTLASNDEGNDSRAYDDGGFPDNNRSVLEAATYADTMSILENEHEPLLKSLITEVNTAFGETWPTQAQKAQVAAAVENYIKQVGATPGRAQPDEHTLMRGLALITVSNVTLNPVAVGTLLRELSVRAKSTN